MAVKEKEVKLRLIGGAHVVGRGNDRITYKRGDVFMSDVDLRQVFKGKFEKIEDLPVTIPSVNAPPAVHRAPEPAEVAQAEAVVEENEETDDAGPKMEDVTGLFPKASKAGLKVFKGPDKKYMVCDPDDLETNLADKLLKKTELIAFLEEHGSK